jgi:hypothetical protein
VEQLEAVPIALLWIDEGLDAVSSFSNNVVAANPASIGEDLDYLRALLKDSIEMKDSVYVAYEPCSHHEALQVYLQYAN